MTLYCGCLDDLVPLAVVVDTKAQAGRRLKLNLSSSRHLN